MLTIIVNVELPDCRYTSRQDVSVISMDELQFAASRDDCQSLCDQVRYSDTKFVSCSVKLY